MIRHRLAAAVAGLTLLSGCSQQEGPSAAPTAQPSQAQTPPASPSPSPSASPTMTRKQACQQVTEAAVDFTYLAAKTQGNPTLDGIAAGDLQTVSGKIRDALPFLDERTAEQARELTYPLDMMYGVIDTGEDATIDFSDARDAVPAVMKSCRGQASLKNYVSPYQP
jgi:hypothetical protein